MSEYFQSDRLLLAPFNNPGKNTKDILTWANDPEVIGHISSFSQKKSTFEDTHRYVVQIMHTDTDRVFTISRINEYIGQIGLHQIHKRSRHARLAVIVKKEFQGKGYGSEAITALLKHAFETMKLNKIWLMVYESNLRGQEFYSKLGFSDEALLREEYFHEGTFHNMLRMCLLKKDWEKGENKS